MTTETPSNPANGLGVGGGMLRPTLHQQLIDTIHVLLKKHEAHHNSVEHAAARALLRKIRGEA